MNLDKIEKLENLPSQVSHREGHYVSHRRTSQQLYKLVHNKIKGYVGKPFDKAYSALIKDDEIKAIVKASYYENINAEVKRHFHINDIYIDENKVVRLKTPFWNGDDTLEGYSGYRRCEYYVHPKTGIIHSIFRKRRPVKKQYLYQKPGHEFKLVNPVYSTETYRSAPGRQHLRFKEKNIMYYTDVNPYYRLEFVNGLWHALYIKPEDIVFAKQAKIKYAQDFDIKIGEEEYTSYDGKILKRNLYKRYRPVRQQLSTKELKQFGLENINE